MDDVFQSSLFCPFLLLFTYYYYVFSRVETSEFSESEAEGLHQEGQKSTQTGPDQQLQTNDFAPVSKCGPREVCSIYCIKGHIFKSKTNRFLTSLSHGVWPFSQHSFYLS